MGPHLTLPPEALTSSPRPDRPLTGLTFCAARSPPSKVKGSSGAGHPVPGQGYEEESNQEAANRAFRPVMETEIFTLPG